MKYEILSFRSETNSNYTKLNVQNSSLPKACRDSGWLALSPCCAAAYDMQTEMSVKLCLLAVCVSLLANR